MLLELTFLWMSYKCKQLKCHALHRACASDDLQSAHGICPISSPLSRSPLFIRLLMEGRNMVAALGSVYIRDPIISSSIMKSS